MELDGACADGGDRRMSTKIPSYTQHVEKKKYSYWDRVGKEYYHQTQEMQNNKCKN